MPKKNNTAQKASEEKVAEITSKTAIITALISFLGVITVAVLGYLGSRPSSSTVITDPPSQTPLTTLPQEILTFTPSPHLTATSLPTFALTPRLTYDGYINEGRNCIDTNNFDCALQNFNAAIAIAPDISYGYYWRGFLYYKDRNADAAINDFEKSISLSEGNSDTSSAYFYLGRIYSDMKRDYSQSIEYFTESIRRKDNSEFAYCERANAYRNLNQKDSAIKDYRDCIKYATQNNNEYYLNYANEGLSWAGVQP